MPSWERAPWTSLSWLLAGTLNMTVFSGRSSAIFAKWAFLCSLRFIGSMLLDCRNQRLRGLPGAGVHVPSIRAWTGSSSSSSKLCTSAHLRTRRQNGNAPPSISERQLHPKYALKEEESGELYDSMQTWPLTSGPAQARLQRQAQWPAAVEEAALRRTGFSWVSRPLLRCASTRLLRAPLGEKISLWAVSLESWRSPSGLASGAAVLAPACCFDGLGLF